LNNCSGRPCSFDGIGHLSEFSKPVIASSKFTLFRVVLLLIANSLLHDYLGWIFKPGRVILFRRIISRICMFIGELDNCSGRPEIFPLGRFSNSSDSCDHCLYFLGKAKKIHPLAFVSGSAHQVFCIPGCNLYLSLSPLSVHVT
jgi:hypothetical protein